MLQHGGEGAAWTSCAGLRQKNDIWRGDLPRRRRTGRTGCPLK